MKTDPQNPSKIDETGDVKSGRPAGRPKSRRRRAPRPSPASPGPPAPAIGVSPGPTLAPLPPTLLASYIYTRTRARKARARSLQIFCTSVLGPSLCPQIRMLETKELRIQKLKCEKSGMNERTRVLCLCRGVRKMGSSNTWEV